MNFRSILLTFFLCTFALAYGQSDYERLSGKAERFFANEEWTSAHAMYLLMLERQPSEVSTYSHAIVADIMAGDTVGAVEMLPRAMSYEISFDTLLTDVRTTSFSIGRGDLYENYLLEIKNTYPWLNRVADNYLMQYYAFRQNGPELVRYATTMLNGLPENVTFMRMLAHGFLLTGRTDDAKDVWLKIVSLYPDDYDTVVDLANYYDTVGDRESALDWMRRVYGLRPTPYVERRIDALSAVPSKKRR